MTSEEIQAAREAIAASRAAKDDVLVRVAPLLDGYGRALAEVERLGRLVAGYRKLLAVQDAEQAPMLAEIEAWKSATGLECGGDPDGVTPAHLEADLARLRAPPTDAEVDEVAFASAVAGGNGGRTVARAAIEAFQAGRAK